MPPSKKVAFAAKKAAAPPKTAPAKKAEPVATVILKHLAAEPAERHDLAEEAGRGSAGRLGHIGHAASQEVRQNPTDRPRDPSSTGTTCSDGQKTPRPVRQSRSTPARKLASGRPRS
jgi:hypothetical protein